jgi:hypothetical protein
MAEIQPFAKEVVNFYIKFFSGVKDSIKILSEIQGKFKSEYKELKEIQNEPTKIYSLISKLGTEETRIVLDLLLRANVLQAKMIKLFDMNQKEQIALSEEMETFLGDFRKFVGV